LRLDQKTLDIAPEDTGFLYALNTVFKYCNENQKVFQKQVLNALFGVQREGSINWKNDEKNALVSYLSKAINDNSLVLKKRII
jgi:hypothetical protein